MFYHMYPLRANHGNFVCPMLRVLSRFCKSPYGNESDPDWYCSVVYTETVKVSEVRLAFTSNLHMLGRIDMVTMQSVLGYEVRGNPKYGRPRSLELFLQLLGFDINDDVTSDVIWFDGCFAPPLCLGHMAQMLPHITYI